MNFDWNQIKGGNLDFLQGDDKSFHYQAAADAGDETPKGGDPYDGYGGGLGGYDENDNDDDDVAEELSAAHANAAAAAAAAASAARNQVRSILHDFVSC